MLIARHRHPDWPSANYAVEQALSVATRQNVGRTAEIRHNSPNFLTSTACLDREMPTDAFATRNSKVALALINSPI
jgi:hypothetical protein